MIQCLIIEDELAAQEILQSYILKTPFIKCLGVYESGLDIPLEILSSIDILFLDIQLPELNGISFLRTLQNPPKVIVTTAFSNYAVEAFEEAVLDYLVKPFSYERFFKAVTRFRDQYMIPQKELDPQLFLYADKTIYKINVYDILYIKAEVDYVKIITSEQQIMILDSLRNWVEKLANFNFLQIHRSYIINLNKFTKVYGNSVYIEDFALPIGKTYKNRFLSIIKNDQ